MSWDISNPIFNVLSKRSADLEVLKDIAVLNNWEVDFVKELSISYQTLVLTDLEQTILWVNDGFQSMTGYAPDYAIGKKPAFLQGPNTSEVIKGRIRETLSSGGRVSETITNYKKNGSAYECQITIIPLIDSNQVITHYLALEREAA
ncbi:PAS domain S-box-containing protein [Algoriphagus antarcticus]|uniref:PAS domain S-box-containing protein n=2 Tax=Algoriphagus antarcticus TaxID=238540 RepID=A0A3E0E7R3_9BACT|nr:PAS domain S-box-containing protein [Algoriphagus antarcticus]